MRTYALYEQSRKVLAFYIVVAVVILSVACVSLDSSGIGTQPNAILFYIVGDAGWEQRKTSRRPPAPRLWWNFESGKVSTSL